MKPPAKTSFKVSIEIFLISLFSIVFHLVFINNLEYHRSVIYINDDLGEDVERLFARITVVGSISDPDAREYGTTVYLCQEPRDSFNKFWRLRLKELREQN